MRWIVVRSSLLESHWMDVIEQRQTSSWKSSFRLETRLDKSVIKSQIRDQMKLWLRMKTKTWWKSWSNVLCRLISSDCKFFSIFHVSIKCPTWFEFSQWIAKSVDFFNDFQINSAKWAFRTLVADKERFASEVSRDGRDFASSWSTEVWLWRSASAESD
jgi:hypothetical protein